MRLLWLWAVVIAAETPADEVRHRHEARVHAVTGDGARALTTDRMGQRILWSPDGTAIVLPRPDAPAPDTDEDGLSYPPDWLVRLPLAAAFSADARRLITTYDSGIFSVHDGVDGALRWQGHTDRSDRETLAEPFTTFHTSSIDPGMAWCDDGETLRALSPPRFTPAGDFVVTAGDHGGHSLLLVWDAEDGEVVQRYRFEHRAHLRGFRRDGRLVVQAGDALFALHAGRGAQEPELVASYLRRGWVTDEGEVGWVSWEEGAGRRQAVPSTTPPPVVRVVDGRAVWASP